MSINRLELEREIRSKLERDDEVKRKCEDFAEEVEDFWKSISPTDSGEYRGSIHVEKRPDVRGLPHFWVGTRDDKAHFIEFGTGPDKPSSDSSYGPDTPTPEFAPAAKTAARFGGTAP